MQQRADINRDSILQINKNTAAAAAATTTSATDDRDHTHYGEWGHAPFGGDVCLMQQRPDFDRDPVLQI